MHPSNLSLALLLMGAVACSKSSGEAPKAPPPVASAPALPGAKLAEQQKTTLPSASVATQASDASTAPAPAQAALDPDEMVVVPAGTFKMGLPEELTGESPVLTKVASFRIDKLEVSTKAYLACVQAGSCELPKKMPKCNATAKKPRLSNPVNCVTKAQAERYCAAQGKRLPTSAEWELAARGTDGRVYPWGSEPPLEQLCWQGRADKETDTTCPVGSFPSSASPSGALDMAGNVAEWTSTPDLSSRAPGEPTVFQIRGGGFPLSDIARAESDRYDVRADKVNVAGMNDVLNDVGFRCAKDL